MSKITFRADEELVARLEAFDASKSEVMREALRTFLDAERADSEPAGAPDSARTVDTRGVDGALAERVDQLIGARLDELLQDRRRAGAQDINVNISVDGASGAERTVNGRSEGTSDDQPSRKTRTEDTAESAYTGEKSCKQCGENLSESHVYCPNCGEKSSNRIFCECGDELRSDWAFCPGCGRRTAAADVLDHS